MRDTIRFILLHLSDGFCKLANATAIKQPHEHNQQSCQRQFRCHLLFCPALTEYRLVRVKYLYQQHPVENQASPSISKSFSSYRTRSIQGFNYGSINLLLNFANQLPHHSYFSFRNIMRLLY